jgi:hypothetical protein
MAGLERWGYVYLSPGWQRYYPRVQLLTIADLLNGAEVKTPPAPVRYRQAKCNSGRRADQEEAGLLGELWSAGRAQFGDL